MRLLGQERREAGQAEYGGGARETGRFLHPHEHPRVPRPGRLARKRNSFRITAESLDIAANPVERTQDIRYRKVAGRHAGHTQITENPEPIVEGDDNRAPRPGEFGSAVAR